MTVDEREEGTGRERQREGREGREENRERGQRGEREEKGEREGREGEEQVICGENSDSQRAGVT